MSTIPNKKSPATKTTKSDPKMGSKPTQGNKDKFELNKPMETKPEIPLPL